MLYTDNKLIVVSCNWEAMPRALNLLGVVGVSINQSNVARFRQHFLRLHIAFPPSFMVDNSDQMKPSETLILASFLLLQNDLDRFVRMLNILSFKTQSDKRSLLLQNHVPDGAHAT